MGDCARRLKRRVVTMQRPLEPRHRTVLAVRGARIDVVDPLAGDRADIEHREHRPVVLEAFALRRAPDRDQITVGAQMGVAGDSQATEADVAPLPRLLEQEERRYVLVGIPGRVERSFQNLVALAGSLMELAARCLVVTEVDETASVRIEKVRPVRIVARCVKHNQTYIKRAD